MTRTLQTLIAAALIAIPVAMAGAQTVSKDLDAAMPKAVETVRHDGQQSTLVLAQETPAASGAAAEASAERHEARQEAQDQEKSRGLLDPDPGAAVWAIVLFVLLLAILGKFAWGPILKALQDREGKIRHDLEHAENAAKQAAATLAEYRTQLAAANDEVRKIIDQGRSDAERIKAQLAEQTQAEVNSIRTRAQAEIRAAKEQAVSEIVTQTTSMATDIAAKILRRQINLNPDDQRQLVQDSLAAASRVGGPSNN